MSGIFWVFTGRGKPSIVTKSKYRKIAKGVYKHGSRHKRAQALYFSKSSR